MLVRDAPAAGIEVFMLQRTAKAAFGAGMYVFPGGRVDEIDGAGSFERFCEGLDDVTASAALGVERGGLAYWVAAVRECFEEAGLLLAHRRDGGSVDVDNEARRGLHAGELSMEELCRRHHLVLDLARVRYVAHWVTPTGEGARRFDTRFFLAAAPHGQDAWHDESETVDSRWVRPHEAVAQAAVGELVMMPPTIANLRFLAEADSTAAAFAAADAAGPPPRIQPRIRRRRDGTISGVALPGDPDYDTLV